MQCASLGKRQGGTRQLGASWVLVRSVDIEMQRGRLLDLIDYVEATERDRLKVVFDFRDHVGFRATEAELADLPGVSLNCGAEDDPIWLRVERLAKVSPPAPADPELALWVSYRDDVGAMPALKTDIVTAGLIELGLLDDSDAPERMALEGYERQHAVELQFRQWAEGPWAEWVAREKPRRETIKLYNALYMLRQQLDGVSDIPVELVCGMGLATLSRGSQRLRYPLITMALELSLHEATHSIEARPRMEADPGIEIDPLDRMELHSLEQWRSATEKFLSGLEDESLSPFAIDSFEPALRQAAALLDPDAIYIPDADPSAARAIPPVEPHLRISAAFAFFQRERRATQLMEDLRRFKNALTDDEELLELPDAVAALLIEPSDAIEEPEYPQFRGVSTIPGVTSSNGDGRDLFFPKAFNREQVEVVQRLQVRPGVVVQGPPGTGKTHTIANIISHYLALGKRVLVTSQKAPALRVLRDKLPEAVRPLAVSLLDSDREGLKQFQQSVDIIAEKLQRLRRHELEREIADLDHQIDSLHRNLARIDNAVDTIGRQAVSPVILNGETIEPVRAARMIVAAPDISAWLPDEIDVLADHDPQFSASDVVALRQARKNVGPDLAYLDVQIPKLTALPLLDGLLVAHRDLSQAEELRRKIGSGSLPAIRCAEVQAHEQLQNLSKALDELNRLETKVAEAGFAWTAEAVRVVRAGQDVEFRGAIDRLHPDIEHLAGEASYFLTRPIELPDAALGDEKLLEAISRLAEGKAATGLVGGMFAGKLKAQLAQVSLLGEPIRSADHWQEALRYVGALKATRRLRQAWNHLVSHDIGDRVGNEGLSVAKRIQGQLLHLETVRSLIAQQASVDELARNIIAQWTQSVSAGAGVRHSLGEIVDAHLLKYRLESAETERKTLLDRLDPCDGKISDQLRQCAADMLGNPDVSAEQFRDTWQSLRKRLGEIEGFADAFETVTRVTHLISASGAERWATSLRADPAIGNEDPLLSGDWEQRWRLRRLATWLSRIDHHSQLRELGRERSEKEQLLKEAYERSIELRTWQQLSLKATDGVKSALAAYADAVRRIGKGTGKRAGRYRREARAASDRAKGALPCWIMPHHRVSESLPADLGLFDLVIVDEASQSTVSALPALLRADKILIVGDDKQVSPELVGRDQERADELAARHLSTQVPDYRSSLREEQSLYDLGKVVFAGGAIMLTEHFRCVAPIIEFSKAQFYNHRLTPLRLPKASERLDPPLVDVMVEDGYRRDKVNPAEADFIVSEIEKIAADDAMQRRTIGVTTLLGQDQAAHIFGKIEDRLGTEVMERHEIRIGDPTAFQGDERDIMFVSLVAEKQDTPLSGLRYEQRFNVALSRAKDRTYLVRSVELDQLRSSDQLRRALLEHFRFPFAAEGSEVADRKARCESDFELEVFDLLVERGYRVNTQVRVGNFRIDLVVEGENDRRIAVECDGDRYHGPDKWSDDMMRQRILERAGWIVWRCFASRFVRNRNAVVEELVSFLEAHGISPVGADSAWESRHTERRSWRSSVAQAEEGGEPAPIAEKPSQEEGSWDSTDQLPQAGQTGAELDLGDQPQMESGAAASPGSPADNSSRVTEADVQREILSLLADGRPWTNGALKRALADILPLSQADRAPANFRPNEEKWEELVNNALSPSRGNSLHAKGMVKSSGRGIHVLASVEGPVAVEANEPTVLLAPTAMSFLPPVAEVGQDYQYANLVVEEGDEDKLYESAYLDRLCSMIDQVLDAEAPIYADLLVDRIARAHGKERSGRIIQETVLGAINGSHPRMNEDDRTVVFRRGAESARIVAYRPARTDWRSHRDIPVIELASLALPLVRKQGSNEEILAHFGKVFDLTRLREPTRKRFEAAISIARAAASAPRS